MSEKGLVLSYAAGATLLALLVVGVGVVLAEPAALPALVAGAGFGLVLQLAVFATTLAVARRRRLLAFGIGAAARLIAVVVAAVVAMLIGLPLAPMLLTLVSVFVLTSMLEPALFHMEIKTAR